MRKLSLFLGGLAWLISLSNNAGALAKGASSELALFEKIPIVVALAKKPCLIRKNADELALFEEIPAVTIQGSSLQSRN